MLWLYAVFVIIGIKCLDWLLRIPRVSGLHKKCVVITGCDSGFGNALAKSLYSKGVYVFAGCFTEPGASKLSEETGERVKTFMLDVRKTESIEKAYEYVKTNIPKGSVLWGLVNNAGIFGVGGPCEIVNRQDMLDAMNVNCFGMVEMVRVFLPLIKQSRGRIVNTASGAGIISVPAQFPYGASKFALFGYSEALRQEKAVWGIKVATVCPGLFNTAIVNFDLLQRRLNDKLERVNPTIIEEYGKEYFDTAYDGIKGMVHRYAPTDVSPVVKAHEHALFARYPRAKYFPGIDVQILIYIHSWCPWITDIYIRCTMGKIPKILQIDK